MASHIVIHTDGKQYRREFVTGRTPKGNDKYQHQIVSLPPSLKQHVPNWKQLTGKSYSEWVQDEMRKAIYIETV